jgi:NADH-quinone oxidoreductase subunit K
MDATSLVLLATAGALFAIGLATLFARSNLVQMVIGLELMGKGVSLVFIAGGAASGDVGTAQAVVFTLIVIEAVVAAVALGLVILAKRTFATLDVSVIAAKLRGGGP